MTLQTMHVRHHIESGGIGHSFALKPSISWTLSTQLAQTNMPKWDGSHGRNRVNSGLNIGRTAPATRCDASTAARGIDRHAGACSQHWKKHWRAPVEGRPAV